jgi:DNA-directed RNA polymerase subunit RPC12/RpoP
MSRVTTIDGIKYVQRKYKCYDCGWSWEQVTTSDQPMQSCPHCANQEKYKLAAIGSEEEIKDKRKHGPKIPKSRVKKLDFAGGKAPAVRNVAMAKAVSLAENMALSQGFSDIKDTNVREGDTNAPPIDNAVTRVLKQGYGLNSGWTGNEVPGYQGQRQTDTLGIQTLDGLQNDLKTGARPDMLRSNLIKDPT